MAENSTLNSRSNLNFQLNGRELNPQLQVQSQPSSDSF